MWRRGLGHQSANIFMVSNSSHSSILLYQRFLLLTANIFQHIAFTCALMLQETKKVSFEIITVAKILSRENGLVYNTLN